MRDIAVSRIMTTDPKSVGPDIPIGEARLLLESESIHHLPVVENEKLVGILSSSDLLKLFLMDDGADELAAVKVRQIMKAEPDTVASDADLITVATRLADSGFHALPVVESDRTLVGIVTSSDLIDHLLHQVPRGDGSVRSVAAPEVGVRVTDRDIADAIHEAKAFAEGGNVNKMASALLHYQEQNQLLQAVCKSAELYMRSGHAEHEHSVLVKRLADVRRLGS